MDRHIYQWLIWSMLSQEIAAHDATGDDPNRIAVDGITGVSGRLRMFQTEAANDLEARLLILLLVWWLVCANYCAKLISLRAGSREISIDSFSLSIDRYAAIQLHLMVSNLVRGLCQIEYLPIALEYLALFKYRP